MTSRLVHHATLVALLAVTSRVVAAPVSETPSSMAASVPDHASTFVAATDARFVYEGRFDTSGSSGPVIIWQGSRIRIEFEGDSVALRFDAIKGQTFLDAEIDGRATIIELREGAAPVGAEFSNLGTGRHQLVLFKRSEAAAGTVRFLGVTLSRNGKAFAPVAPHYTFALQFFGDSITAGACNEDGATDQWDDRRTHNNALSYAALTAKTLGADYRNIAVSGMGIAIGWVEMKAGEIWDRIYPDPASPRADLTTWKPDVLCINLGENDDSFSNSKGLPFPSEGYTNGYISLVQAIRRAYPSAHIVLLRGGMFGGARSEKLRSAWEAAVQQIEASDPKVSHFVFRHWSSTHPRVSDHRAMAEELTAWLKTQLFVIEGNAPAGSSN